ncbi:MAG: M23 family metallopeptidase [Armatimonadota bacterium]|nr:M23 family metallopeptidase [Armatimonadota bacterium]MDR7443921.1 M23 family metallopeptidase [Armatimonadota bacterium]MDR7570421.1 M23 family metallopeptidase [Armatimonadota bacterium]MDR7613220.1 M23 family metallopeptidase [Armatimonadota bacterium]
MRKGAWVVLCLCLLVLGFPDTSRGATPGRVPPLVHIVRPGDTLWDLARRYGVTVEAIAAANGMKPTQVLRIGQVLRIPGRGISQPAVFPSHPPAPPGGQEGLRVYTVRPGDSLWLIARRYGVTVQALMDANGLRSDRLRTGQRLRIPASGTSTQISVVRRRVGFLWPARGVITSRFGRRWRRHHDGIDISAPRGTPIHAARSGRVRHAGWYGGYGLLVVLDHGGGLETFYGHASRLFVRPGQWVQQGQRIAAVGCTGACTGSHLHFEVRVRGQPVDPLRYLR